MEFIYIYNHKQADFFIKEGVVLASIGMNKKSNKLFFKFVRGSGLREAFHKWNNRK